MKDFAIPSGSSKYEYTSVSELTALGGKLVFVANDGTHGSQVWASDGTPGGTQMLTTVNDTANTGSSVVSGADPGSLTVVGGKLYFSRGYSLRFDHRLEHTGPLEQRRHAGRHLRSRIDSEPHGPRSERDGHGSGVQPDVSWKQALLFHNV